MKVAVFGAGYVGLVTGVCLAVLGHEVVCIDVDAGRVAAINSGTCPIHEPGLPEHLAEVLASGRFWATTEAAEGLAGAELSLVAVGTPDHEGQIDLTAVDTVAACIGTHLREVDNFHGVVMKSTVVPGTTGGRVRDILESRSGKVAGVGFGLAMNPEFLREGSGVEDFLHPDRIVIGSLGAKTETLVEALYEAFDCPRVHLSLVDAELVKYASNALLATLVSFSNEIFGLCEATPGAHGRQVLQALHLDGRLMPMHGGERVKPGLLSYLMGGIGYGGSCLPKDLNALTASARHRGHSLPLLESVIRVNQERPRGLVAGLGQMLGNLRGCQVAVLGMAFKPGTDDWRHSPSLPLIDALLKAGATVRVWDPLAGLEGAAAWGAQARLFREPKAALEGADAAVVATAWPEMLAWPWEQLVSRMRNPVILDGRQMLASVTWPEGTTYRAVGDGEEV